MGSYPSRAKKTILQSTIFSVHIAKEQDVSDPSNWITNFKDCINTCFTEDDAMLDFSINKELTLILSCKKMMYFFLNKKKILTRLQFPWKVKTFFQSFDKVYILNEFNQFLVIKAPLKEGCAKYSDLESSDIVFDPVKGFPKVDCLAVRDMLLVVVTQNNQICVKDDLSNKYSDFDIFQSKRCIQKVTICFFYVKIYQFYHVILIKNF